MIFEDSVKANNQVTPTVSSPKAGLADSGSHAQKASNVAPLKKKKKLKDSTALKATADSLQMKAKADSILVQAKTETVKKWTNVPPCLLDPNREGSYTAYFSMKTVPAKPATREFSSYDLLQTQTSTAVAAKTKDSTTQKAIKLDSTKKIAIFDTTKKDSTKVVSTIDTAKKAITVITPTAPPKTHSSSVQKYVPKVFRSSWGDKDWMLWYIIAAFILFIIARFTYKKYIQQIFIASANIHVTNRLFRERNSLTSRVSFYLNILFCFNVGLFAYQIINYFSISILNINGFFVSLLFGFLFVFIYIGKYILLELVGFLFNESDLVEEYNHTVFLFNKIVGLLLFPVVIMMPYLKNQYINETHIIGFGLFVIIAAYIMRLLRGIVLSLRQNISILYTFLYLCILEFVPLILILKVILVVAKYL